MKKLIFIDTNIFLDFYRFRNSDISLKYLDLIDKHHEVIITSSQVEMEYKKHRAKEIKKTYDGLTLPNWNTLTPPAILADSEPAQLIIKSKKVIETQQKALKKRMLKVFDDPVRHDKVFQTAQRLFKDKLTNLNLNRENKERFRLRKLALKRFYLGYPPRKSGETSIGDAVNWEWIIDCGIRLKADIIIVSRDSDYGQHLSERSIINEWLDIEYKERVGRRRKVTLTNKLSSAFKEVVSKKSVTKSMETAEQAIIQEKVELDNSGQLRTNEDKLKALQITLDKLEKLYKHSAK
jgi:predicted nucleic acid-binding protein